MAEHFLPDLKISTETEEADIKKLIQIIKPSWNLERLKVKELSGGFSSRIVRCYSEDNADDSVTIRVRKILAELMKGYEQTFEVNVVQHLSKLGHFPKVHAIFANGYCYQYVQGKPMAILKTTTGHVNETMLRAMANEMAFVHSIKMEGVEYNEESITNFMDCMLENIDSEKNLENGLNRRVLVKEYSLITNYLRSKKPNLVLCHGDPQPANYIWNEAQEKITFIDWEATRIGYQLGEIAQLFATTSVIDDIFVKKTSKPVIDKGYQERFVRHYIKAWRELQNDNKTVTEDDITQWMEEIEEFMLVPLHIHMIYAYQYPELIISLSDDASLLDEVYENYLKLKEKVLGKGSFETE